ncbi:hypothetical protein [Mycolicibacterium neoaurum]|uniref:Uncharacterized protein n=1 Tax=Mycolicibacterium neoaurum TaxID=1795 RepID=A0AAV2WG50_MYCNE|nr:hypothetical protein [Mycolicibacterium neoaurum]CDQ43191.1 hypothetical protein BN1047_01054 [Mycolicibacterium neoaurum]
MSNHDPFKHLDPNHERHQRINQVNSQAGAPAVLDWPALDKMAETIANNGFGRISALDDDEEARNLARETILLHRKGVEHVPGAETVIGEHAGPQHDPSLSLQTADRLYGLLAFDTKVIFPLSENFTWRQLSEKYLSRYRVCDVDVSIGCERTNAGLVIAIKSGEFVCIYKTCESCRKWFSQPDREHFRTRTFFDDLWDRR